MKRIFLSINNTWQSATAYSLGQQIVSSGYVQQVTTAGTSGSSIPIFSTTTGVTTTDNTVIWTCVGATSAPTWIVPTDFGSNNTIECIGSGGAGGEGATGVGTGGGGGAYSSISGLSLTAGDSIPYILGTAASSSDGSDTFFNGVSIGVSSVGAKGGKQGNTSGGTSAPSGLLGGAGGLASSSVGTIKFSGGAGGDALPVAPGTARDVATGGGGAAGPNGAGAKGGSCNNTSGIGVGGGGGGGGGGSSPITVSPSNASAGGNNYLGTGGGANTGVAGTDGGGGGGNLGFPTGGAGGNGIEWDSSHGSGGGGGGSSDGGGDGGNYGGGGAGAGGGASGEQGISGPGIIVITYDLFEVTCVPSSAPLRTFYSQTFSVEGGTAPFTFAIIGGSLPPGLMLDSSTGIVSGTPTQVGTFPYEIQVTDVNSLTATTSCTGIIVAVSFDPIPCN